MHESLEYNQITGVVEDVVFYNSENSFTVLDVSSGGELITAVGTLPEITAGEKVVLTGVWDMHQSFGRQFRINRFERYLPDTAAQFLKYLSSVSALDTSDIRPSSVRSSLIVVTPFV